MLHILRMLERRFPERAPLIRMGLVAASTVLLVAGVLAVLARS